MSNEYNFYKMGVRYAIEGLENLRRKAESIGKEFGEDAKLEFESGICSIISSFSTELDDVSIKEIGKATINYGIPGTRNNSYFEGTGISNQTQNGHYNEPKKIK